jgi:hypothetical protein
MSRKYGQDGRGHYRGIFWCSAAFSAGQYRAEELAGVVRLSGSPAGSPAEGLRKAGR